MPPLVEEMLRIRREIKRLHLQALTACMEINRVITTNKAGLGELVDLAFLCQDTAKLSDEVRKENHKIEETIEKVACAAWTLMMTQDPTGTAGHLEGDIARGTPKMGFSANVPDRKSPEYIALMKHLGAPDQLLADDVLRPHWPHLCEAISAKMEQGAPPPPGIDPASLKPRYRLVALKPKKGVQLDD